MMRVAHMSKAKGPFELVEREIPEPGPNTVRVAVGACAGGEERRKWTGGGGAEKGDSVNWASIPPMLVQESVTTRPLASESTLKP
jgi:hypothetical protein